MDKYKILFAKLKDGSFMSGIEGVGLKFFSPELHENPIIPALQFLNDLLNDIYTSKKSKDNG